MYVPLVSSVQKHLAHHDCVYIPYVLQLHFPDQALIELEEKPQRSDSGHTVDLSQDYNVSTYSPEIRVDRVHLMISGLVRTRQLV